MEKTFSLPDEQSSNPKLSLLLVFRPFFHFYNKISKQRLNRTKKDALKAIILSTSITLAIESLDFVDLTVVYNTGQSQRKY